MNKEWKYRKILAHMIDGINECGTQRIQLQVGKEIFSFQFVPKMTRVIDDEIYKVNAIAIYHNDIEIGSHWLDGWYNVMGVVEHFCCYLERKTKYTIEDFKFGVDI